MGAQTHTIRTLLQSFSEITDSSSLSSGDTSLVSFLCHTRVSQSAVLTSASPQRSEKCQFMEPPRSPPALQSLFSSTGGGGGRRLRFFQVRIDLGFNGTSCSKAGPLAFRAKEGEMEWWRQSRAGLKMRERSQLLQLDFQRYPLLQQVLKKDRARRERQGFHGKPERFQRVVFSPSAVAAVHC